MQLVTTTSYIIRFIVISTNNTALDYLDLLASKFNLYVKM